MSHCLLWYVWIPVRIEKKSCILGYWTVWLYFPSVVLLAYKRTAVILDYLHPLSAMFSTQIQYYLLNPFPSSATEQSSLGSPKRPNPDGELGPVSLYSQGKTPQLLFKKLWIVTQSHHLNLSHFQERVPTLLSFLLRDKLLGNWT